MKVDIICPLYNASNYINSLHSSLMSQTVDFDVSIRYALTESTDNTLEILKGLNLEYVLIKKEEFSHSRTREIMAMDSESDIIVFISQDVMMKNDKWLSNLVNPIINGVCEAAFSRQICENNSIEKYIREKNYPEQSRIVSKEDIDKLGLMTFFYSDASSAVKTSVYKELNGYDGKHLIINEDMYLAHKIIENGFRIKYCADSEVYHSHTFTLRQLFNRYFDTGVFFKINSIFLTYKGNQSGMALFKHVLLRAVKEMNFKVLLILIPNFATRYIGNILGQKYEKLSSKKRIKYSLDKKYWTRFEEDI
ncbi:glycosyltransferase [Clostridium sp. C8-1-8]|uniref:glycosyltransferase n=1 Tax=Clostridium sp. C8-1-8 TaxID=2698831 RepID=UPI00136AC010|nr:glycosyltransferase [Clostridium sp. C8-1-8]